MSDNQESKRFGAQGGKKRAASMTKAARSEAAQRAALARWGSELPVAAHTGTLEIGDLQIPCSVLEDGTRVLSEAGFTKALGRARSGTAWMRGNDPGARMPHYAPPKNLIEFIDEDLASELRQPIRYLSRSGGKIGYGVNASLIPRICEAWLKARDAGRLNKQQKRTAAQAEILMRGLAHVGIIALVDEATGYQAIREQDALAKFLSAYVAKELRQWVRTFPRSFFEQLCRLKGISFPRDMRLPQYFGHIVNDIVYERLAPGVKDELQRINPVVGAKGRRRHKHHQWLTEGIGNPKLLHHLGLLEGIAQAFDDGDWDGFYAVVNKRLANYASLPLFAQVEAAKQIGAAPLRALPTPSGAVEDADFEILSE